MIIGTSAQALAFLKSAQANLSERDANRKTRWSYYMGEHTDLPFAPEGVDKEYLALREMSPLPLIRLAVRTPCQRLRIKGLQTTSEQIAKRHRRIWQINRLDSGQRTPYVHGMVYSTGIMSVWPNLRVREEPVIRSEDPNITWLEYDPADPLQVAWSAKIWTEKSFDTNGKPKSTEVGIVYDDEKAWRFERQFATAFGDVTTGWDAAHFKTIPHPLKTNPMTPFVPELDAAGKGHSLVEPLIPMQRAIDTMRFDLLLAAQFAAYRQRIATGYDPVLRDNEGNPIWARYPVGHAQAGEIVLDPTSGQPIPQISTPGKVGVDRMLVFPGADTHIFDLPESNLDNYASGLSLLVGSFASVAQVPPQYLVGDFKNVSGDLMVATEATLRSLLGDLKTSYGESMELVHQKAGTATGDEAMVDREAEVIWEETGPVSLQQIAGFAAQMVPLGFPIREVVEMVPGISQARAAALDLTPPAPPAPATPPAGEPSGATAGPTPGDPAEESLKP